MSPPVYIFTGIGKLPAECREAYLGSFERQLFPKNYLLVRTGEVCRHLYFLEKGAARAFYYDLDGREITSKLTLETTLITPIYNFVTGKPSYESIELLEKSVVHQMPYDRLESLFAQFHELERLGRKMMEAYFVYLEEHLMTIKFQTAQNRYKTLLSQSPGLLQRVPLVYIASYLGITPETLSRIRGTA